MPEQGLQDTLFLWSIFSFYGIHFVGIYVSLCDLVHDVETVNDLFNLLTTPENL